MATDAVQPVTGSLPILFAPDGHAYVGADAVVALLRAIAATCRGLHGDPDCDVLTLAETLDVEADNLDCRAIAHTDR